MSNNAGKLLLPTVCMVFHKIDINYLPLGRSTLSSLTIGSPGRYGVPQTLLTNMSQLTFVLLYRAALATMMGVAG